jgi:adenosylcobinamide-GDP ribazoletransferase
MLKQEIRIFFTALMFYTRIPCPKCVDHDEEYINKATRYFPFIGWIVGGISFASYYSASLLFPSSIAVIISIIVGVLVTGAFHEDGFADVCDGFGGGWTKEKILVIMKDSRVGAYGVIGLVLLFLLKYALLVELVKTDLITLALIFLSAHALSRLMAVVVIATSFYARDGDDSKAKPVAQFISLKTMAIAVFFGLLPLLIICYQSSVYAIAILPCLLVTLYLRKYFNRWIGGYTGDCLGATQQVNEIVIYLSYIIVWKFF